MAIRTVSLETARALKEAGWEWPTQFHYDCNDENYLTDQGGEYYSMDGFNAPTAEEILSELPCQLKFDNTVGKVGAETKRLVIYKMLSGYTVGYEGPMNFEMRKSDSLPNALANLWIWLKKEGLIK